MRNYVEGWFRRDHKERFYALKDVSFRLDLGESLALVGSNGAGKSTLLSLIAGLAEPDSGRVRVNGRIGALLQLGSGFHPDLTGTENIRLNAALLGLGRRRTTELFGDIVEFSGIGDFVDEPLRTYSSGMMMRLAFSVAVHLDPDILIIDEVLAVGDAAFQAKCIGKLEEHKRSGKTLLFVTHAVGSVQQLCDRAIWLDHGQSDGGRTCRGSSKCLRGPVGGSENLRDHPSPGRVRFDSGISGVAFRSTAAPPSRSACIEAVQCLGRGRMDNLLLLRVENLPTSNCQTNLVPKSDSAENRGKPGQSPKPGIGLLCPPGVPGTPRTPDKLRHCLRARFWR